MCSNIFKGFGVPFGQEEPDLAPSARGSATPPRVLACAGGEREGQKEGGPSMEECTSRGSKAGTSLVLVLLLLLPLLLWPVALFPLFVDT